MTVASQTVAPVTVQISGGLGNQLFQYAAARALALASGAQLILDAHFFDQGRHRQFELSQFPIQGTVIGHYQAPRLLRGPVNLLRKLRKVRLKNYQEPHFHFDPSFEQVRGPVYLKGYFQSPRYFESAAATVHKELQPPQATDHESLELADLLSHSNSISLHVRRGDYVKNPAAAQLFHSCSLDYYQQALEQLPVDGPVVVFSDDVEWVRQNLPTDARFRLAGTQGPRTGLADLWLMSKAEHHVIANSTFSWWGAWLGSSASGQTIAPRLWFRDPNWDCRDLIPNDWIRI